MSLIEASLTTLMFVVLGIYLALKAIGWLGRRLLQGPAMRRDSRQGHKETARDRDSTVLRKEDIQDARFTDVDPDA